MAVKDAKTTRLDQERNFNLSLNFNLEGVAVEYTRGQTPVWLKLSLEMLIMNMRNIFKKWIILFVSNPIPILRWFMIMSFTLLLRGVVVRISDY